MYHFFYKKGDLRNKLDPQMFAGECKSLLI